MTSATDASKVKVSGTGLQSGLLATFQSDLLVETKGAGPGRLTVRVRGPKGAFHVEMAKDETKDRAIRCRYNPTEVGQYVLHIQWSGAHVPGSPFTVAVVDTRRELAMFPANGGLSFPGGTFPNGGAFSHAAGGQDGPIFIGSGSDLDGGASMRLSSLNGDGLFFNDDL